MKPQRSIQGRKGTSAVSSALPLSGDRVCRRCGGFVVHDFAMDLLGDQAQNFLDIFRCLQCGEVLDAVILKNRHADMAHHAMTTHRRRWSFPQSREPLTS